jgi:hypothetical protein
MQRPKFDLAVAVVVIAAAVLVGVVDQPTRLTRVEQDLGHVLGCARATTASARVGGYPSSRQWTQVVSEVHLGCSSGQYAPLYVVFHSRHATDTAYAEALRGGPDPVCHTRTEIFTVGFDLGPLLAREFCALVGASVPVNPLRPRFNSYYWPYSVSSHHQGARTVLSTQTLVVIVAGAALGYLILVMLGGLLGRPPSTRLRLLLALLAVACVGLGIHYAPSRGPHRPYWGFNLAANNPVRVNRVLADLHVPAGFNRQAPSACRFPPPGIGVACFTRPRSIVLTAAMFARLMASTGASPAWLGPVECIGVPRGRPLRLGLRPETCGSTLATINDGTVLLTFAVNSVIDWTATSVTSATRADGPFPAGTQLAVTVTAFWHPDLSKARDKAGA